MYLNTLSPAVGSKFTAKRLGRGVGSGFGKTCGKGHKGQKARAGGYHKVGFEGGQTPIQRRLPKFGFKSKKALVTAEVRLSDLNKLIDARLPKRALQAGDASKAEAINIGNDNYNKNVNHDSKPIKVDLNALRVANLINHGVKYVKIIATGKVYQPMIVHSSALLKISKGAQKIIESVGGKVFLANVEQV